MIRRESRGLFQQHRSKRESALFEQFQLPPATDMPRQGFWVGRGILACPSPRAGAPAEKQAAKDTWRLTVSLRTQSPSKCPTVYGGGEPLRAADDQWCSEARSVHRVA
jgi:hypothetical protein